MLVYPQFNSSASEFVLQTDASDVGIGAVLEQEGHAVAFSSCSLTKSECNYSVIQKECLAAVYAMKQSGITCWGVSLSSSQITLLSNGYLHRK